MSRGPTPYAGDIVVSPLTMLELCASRQKPPSDQRVRVLAAPASSMPARSWRRLAAGAASQLAPPRSWRRLARGGTQGGSNCLTHALSPDAFRRRLRRRMGTGTA